VTKLDAEIWFRFDSGSVLTANADLQRLKDAAAKVGFDLRGAKVTPATPGEWKAGWTEESEGGGTSYVPLEPEQ